MHCLVTGATGFVGRHLVRTLRQQFPATDISCLVKTPLNDFDRSLVKTWRLAGIDVLEGDLCDEEVSQRRSPDADVVFHLAANTDTAAAAEALRVNDLGCRHLLDWVGRSAGGRRRIIYTSSIAVLDRNAPAEEALDESSPCVPRTAYGLTKLRGEQILRAECGRLDFDYTILRLATVYGPGAKSGGLFDRLISLNSKGELLGRVDWPGHTSIIHVDDVARIMVFLATHPRAANQIYCIANPEAPTVGAIAAEIRKLTPAPRKALPLPGWLWRVSRRAVWSRPARYLGAHIATVTFWRLTLVVDDGFWFNTQKLQELWSQPPVELLEGIAEMIRNLPL